MFENPYVKNSYQRIYTLYSNDAKKKLKLMKIRQVKNHKFSTFHGWKARVVTMATRTNGPQDLKITINL